MRVDDVFAFAKERHNIYLRRAEGNPGPFTNDGILHLYRFCNVYRELDKVTLWVAENWREPNQFQSDLWFAMAVARHVNNIPTLEALPFPLPWDRDAFLEVMLARKMEGEKTFSPAYMISTNGNVVEDKAAYLADAIFTPLWENRESIRPFEGDTLASFHTRLRQFHGIASFLAAQIVADTKYVSPLKWAVDWHTFAASGPGSKRGLNRVLGNRADLPWNETGWFAALTELRAALIPKFEELGWEVPHAQDVQNILCEFDKYERARLGEGRPKQLFRG